MINTEQPSSKPYKFYETNKTLFISKFLKIHKEDVENAKEALKHNVITQPLKKLEKASTIEEIKKRIIKFR